MDMWRQEKIAPVAHREQAPPFLLRPEQEACVDELGDEGR
jgi:hypothetical protein